MEDQDRYSDMDLTTVITDGLQPLIGMKLADSRVVQIRAEAAAEVGRMVIETAQNARTEAATARVLRRRGYADDLIKELLSEIADEEGRPKEGDEPLVIDREEVRTRDQGVQ